MNDGIMDEWLLATIKKDMKVQLSEREQSIILAVNIALIKLRRSRRENYDVVNKLYFEDEWKKAKEVAQEFKIKPDKVNSIRRDFLDLVNQNINIKGDVN